MRPFESFEGWYLPEIRRKWRGRIDQPRSIPQPLISSTRFDCILQKSIKPCLFSVIPTRYSKVLAKITSGNTTPYKYIPKIHPAQAMWGSSPYKLPLFCLNVLARRFGRSANNSQLIWVSRQPSNRPPMAIVPHGESAQILSVTPGIIRPYTYAQKYLPLPLLRRYPRSYCSDSSPFHRNQYLEISQDADRSIPTMLTRITSPDRLREKRPNQGHLEPANYQVFLSFRGPDTRQGFVDCLYCFMIDAGIRVFKDDEENRPGDKIKKILEEIKNSMICIPVFSKDYASSTWCLRELAEMIKLNKRIIPIFYDVKPDDVTLKTTLYFDALEALRLKVEGRELSSDDKSMLREEIEQWKKALQEVGTFTGRELRDNGYGEFSKSIVREVSDALKIKAKIVTDHLVGMNAHVETMINFLGIEALDVRYVGIHGMDGIGKTTLAKVIFNRLYPIFEYCIFLSDIRESSQRKGIVYLQKQLLNGLGCKSREILDSDEGIKTIIKVCHNKKVLIVLDDVNQKEQIGMLAGSANWFAMGSRILITSTDKRVLTLEEGTTEPSKGVSTFEMQEMNFNHALQLFSRHAFGADSPPLEYVDLAKEAVSVSGFLPLSLEIIGSLLRCKCIDDWKEKITALRKIPHKNVQEKLMISYEALDYRTQQMFLDIACFLIYMRKTNAIYMWEACDCNPETGIDDLVSMSLVKIVHNKFWMHDHLRDLGRNIVHLENFMDAGKRSRLWRRIEALGMLERKEGTEKVEALCIYDHSLLASGDYPLTQHVLTEETFKNMRNLRFLKLGRNDRFNLEGDFAGLLPNLRWLSWQDCPSHWKATNLKLGNLVVLDLSHSKITEHWDGWSKIKIGSNLKVLDLSCCPLLQRLPDLSKYPSLEKLFLQCCTHLTQIDSSIGMLKNLKLLNVRSCSLLRGLPEELCSLEYLEEIYAEGSWRSFTLPREIGRLKSLANLELVGVGISGLPASICRLKKLKRLSLKGCRGIARLPDSLGDLESLVELDISHTRISELPASICRLKKLKRLSLKGCRGMDRLPESLGELTSLVELDISRTLIAELPESFGSLKELKVVD